MIGLLIRLILGRSAGGFWVGLAMLLVGVGLTAVSYTAASATNGGSYFVFIGLIVGGLARMALSATSLFSGSERGRSAALPLVPAGFLAPPSEMPPGLCWQCGAKVKPDRLICMHCGASLPTAAPQPSQTAQLAGFDADTSSNAIPQQVHTVAGPPPSRGLPSGTYRAGAPSRGMPPGAMPPGGPYPGGPYSGGPVPGWDPRMAGRPPAAGYSRGGGPRSRPPVMPETVRERVEEFRGRAGEFRERAEGLLRPFFTQRERPGAGKGRRPKGYGYGPGGYGPREAAPPGYGPPRYRPRGDASRGHGSRRGPREPEWAPDDDDSASDEWGGPRRRGRY